MTVYSYCCYCVPPFCLYYVVSACNVCLYFIFPDTAAAAPDLFTIKLFHGGNFEENPKRYVGGSFHYVDLCDIDEFGFLELIAMSVELGDSGLMTYYYKAPGTDIEKGLWVLKTDQDVVDMGHLIPPTRFVHIYSVNTPPLVIIGQDGATTQEYAPSQDHTMEFVEGTNTVIDRQQRY